jgi:hypothetical protein
MFSTHYPRFERFEDTPLWDEAFRPFYAPRNDSQSTHVAMSDDKIAAPTSSHAQARQILAKDAYIKPREVIDLTDDVDPVPETKDNFKPTGQPCHSLICKDSNTLTGMDQVRLLTNYHWKLQDGRVIVNVGKHSIFAFDVDMNNATIRKLVKGKISRNIKSSGNINQATAQEPNTSVQMSLGK